MRYRYGGSAVAAAFLGLMVSCAESVAGGYVDWQNRPPVVQAHDTTQTVSGASGVNFVNSVFTDQNLIASVNNDPIRTPSTTDPVSTVTGNNYHDETDFIIKGRGLNFVFTRTYNSAPTGGPGNGLPMGFGWTHSYNMRLRSNDYGECPNCTSQQKPENGNGKTSSITYTDERGGEVNFLTNDLNNSFAVTNPRGIFDSLQLADPAESSAPSLTFRNGTKYVFQAGVNLQVPGNTARLAKIRDPFGNQLTFTYAGSNLTTISDGISIGGRTGVVSLTYTASNQLSGISDWTGRTWSYAYTAAGDLASVTVNVGGVPQAITYIYQTGTHNLKAVMLPELRNGQQVMTTFSYYQNGKTFNYSNSLGQTESIDYDLFRRSTRVTDPRGGVREYFYDNYGQLTKLTEPDGAVLLFENNLDTTLRFRKYDARGFTTTYSYRSDKAFSGPSDTFGQVTREQDALGQNVDYTYGIYDQVTSVTDKKGVTRNFDYYPAGNGNFTGKLQRQRLSQLTVGSVIYTNVLLAEYTYNADGTPATKTEYIDPANSARKRVTTYTYEPGGINLSQTKVSGSGVDVIVDYTYDSLGRKRTQTTHRRLVAGGTLQSFTTSFDYDERDRLVKVTDALGNQLVTVYDKNGKVFQLIANYKRPDNTFDTRILSTRTYDPADRLATQTDIENNTRTFQYDPAGNLTAYTDANAHTTRYQYDAIGRRTAVINANGHRTETSYDLAGRPNGVTNAIGKRVSSTYDALGRPVAVTDAKGFTTTISFDPNNEITKAVDANAKDGIQPVNGTCGGTVCRFYDELNRLVREVNALDGETTYTYDLLGNTLSVRDPEGRVTTYTYDDLGRQTVCVYPGGGTTTYVRDLDGMVLSKTDRKNQTLTYRYDALGRLLEAQYPNGLGQTAADTFSFDIFGKLSSVGQYIVGQGSYPGTALYSYAYDTKGRRTGKTDLRLNRSLTYTYDPVGNIQTKTDYQGQTTTYRYDSSNRLVELGNPDYGATLGQVGYQYDPAGRLLARILANGAKTIYTYDDNNRLTSLAQYSTNDNIVLAQTYNHDQVGNLLSVSDISGTAHYKYDSLYRLTQANYPGTAPDETYTYDRVGNRQTTTLGGSAQVYVVDAANRLKEIHNNSASGTLVTGFSYDANGNLVKKCQGTGISVSPTDCTGSQVTVLAYDGRNRTIGIAANNFKYDPFDYRIEKTDSIGTVQYLLEGEHVEAVYRAAQVESKYLRGVVIDEVVMGQEKDASGQPTAYNFHHDLLQSLNAKSGANGSILQTTTYGAFGNVLSETNSNPNATYVRYTGREQDRDTGLYYYRARYYDSSTGRFLAEDPKGFAAGINFYTYADNNPINANDPSGMDNVVYHFIQTFQAGMRQDLGIGQSLSLAWDVASFDPATRSATDNSALVQNLHGTGGFVQTAAGDFVPQSTSERVAGIADALSNPAPRLSQLGVDSSGRGVLVSQLHTSEDIANLGHASETFTGIANPFSEGIIPFVTSVAEVAYHFIWTDTIAPLFNWGQRVDNAAAVIQAYQNGSSVGMNPETRDVFPVTSPSIPPLSSSPSLDFDLGAAAGGFVLYPNKSNLNMTRSVFQK